VIRKDAVLDRAEQGRDRPEQAERHEQHRHGMEQEAQHRGAGREDLRELEPAGHQRLVVPVGPLAAEARQDEERPDEDRARQRHQDAGMGIGLAADPEQDQEGQRVLQEIVVERREELAPEQWREAPRSHQGTEHGDLSFRT
jgi:hypothetical protein